MSFASGDSFTSSFSVWFPFISFSYLIALTKTSKIPFLVPDPTGDAFRLSPLSMMLAMSLSLYGLYYVEVWSLYAHFLERVMII